MPVNVVTLLPNGENFLLAWGYEPGDGVGVLVLTVISTISAIAVVGLLVSISISAWNTRKSINPNMFVRSHACAYLVSMLLCDLCQAIGSIMSIQWYIKNEVEFGSFCVAQGVIKHIADVGTAVWSLVIAGQAFWILFLRLPTRKYLLYATLISGWSIVGTMVIAGPAALDVALNGPFFGISGHWCWISDHYTVARITLDYMILFLSALFSFILYSMIFLSIRGNLIRNGWRVRFNFKGGKDSNGGGADDAILGIAKQMLWYPVTYTIIILPIAACRFAEWTGHEVSWDVTVFADSIFLLSGLINVVLFSTTRRVLPKHSIITTRFGKSESTKVTTVAEIPITFTETDSIDLEKSLSIQDDGRAPVSAGLFKPAQYPDDDAQWDEKMGAPHTPIAAVESEPANPRHHPTLPPGLDGHESPFEQIPLGSGSSDGSRYESSPHEYSRDSVVVYPNADYVVSGSPTTAPLRINRDQEQDRPRFGTPRF